MASLLLANVLDAARSLGPEPETATPESVAGWLESEYLKKRGGGFNYDPAMRCTYDLFRGSTSPESAKEYCLTHGNPIGRKQNAAAVESIGSFATANISTCYRIGYLAVLVGRVAGEMVYVGVKAPMVRVVHNDAFVVLPGFRMSHRPADREIDTACSVVLAQLARDDLADADFEYLYAGPGLSGERTFRAIHGRDRDVFDREQVDALMDVYVRGVGLLLADGKGRDKPSFRGYRIYDPRQPSMF